jgi:hypothetical protein
MPQRVIARMDRLRPQCAWIAESEESRGSFDGAVMASLGVDLLVRGEPTPLRVIALMDRLVRADGSIKASLGMDRDRAETTPLRVIARMDRLRHHWAWIA